MADWKSRMSSFAQSAMNKSKEVAGTTKINMEMRNYETKLKKLQGELGAYVLEHPETLNPDKSIEAILLEVDQIQGHMDKLQRNLQEVRNTMECPECGKEIPLDSEICPKCGAVLVGRPQHEIDGLCPNCSAPIDDGMLFCASCGAKLR